ncbi:MAG: hypothetical protein CME65_06705 [Halobacteriovoraceae bacterium]|nr:hypothetical protein [Halobacteriovoraceae bacterium]|tara:strand:- start:6650 stop:7435 length:786 start_codon:yes stop_codon:yes gene_type:complete
MELKYRNLLDKLEPYVVSANLSPDWTQREVLGKRLMSEHIHHPLDLKTQTFVEKIYHLDKLSFGEQGMGMDKWVFVDCSVMPGFVFGFCGKGSLFSEADRKKMKISEEEWFPVSMYIAIPTMQPGKWFGHNLSSLNRHLQMSLSGLGLLTKFAALKFFDIEVLEGATQWFSPALPLHSQIGPLKILSAYTPIHSKPMTICYECVTPQDATCLEGSRRSVPIENELLFNASKENVIQLQHKLEQGESYKIARVKSLSEIYLI